MEIRFINDSVEKFLASLKNPALARTLRTLDLLEQFGKELCMPHSKKVVQNLFELRVRGKVEVRLFYCFYKKKAVVLHGFIKKTQQIPHKEINLVKKRLKTLD